MQSHIKNSLANDQAAEFDEALLTYGEAFANVIQTVQACERYAFLNLYPDGNASTHTSLDDANEFASPSRIECRHIEWEAPA